MQRQTITWTYTNLLSIELLGTNFSEIWIEKQNVIHDNVFKPVICKVAAILSRGKWFKDKTSSWLYYGNPYTAKTAPTEKNAAVTKMA